MKVKWLGHASMLMTSSEGLRIITDPYTSGVLGLNYAPINEEADIVTVSHDHPDHNNVVSVGGIPEVVEEGETGFLVPPGSPEALATALRRAAEDDAWRRRAGEAARRRVVRDFSIQGRARLIEALFDELIEEAVQ